VQRGPADSRRLQVDLRPDARVRSRQLIQSRDKHPVIQHRAADEQWNSLPGEDVFDGMNRLDAESTRRIALVGIEDIHEVVANLRALGKRRLRGSDIHAAIHLRRVDAHDVDRQLPGERERKPRLPAGGRAEQAIGCLDHAGECKAPAMICA
jgi:hypothetical protein